MVKSSNVVNRNAFISVAFKINDVYVPFEIHNTYLQVSSSWL